MNVFELFATLGLDTSSYDKGLDQSESKASSFGAKLKTGLGVAAGVATTAVAATTAAAVAGGKAFVDGAKATAAYGDKIDKTSQKLGISKKAYQELDYVMNLAGTSMDSMSMGMKTLTNQISAAQKGNKDAIKNFKALGISIQDLKTMSQEDLFKKTIAGLQNMEAGTKRSALANKVFGRSGQELQPLLNMTSEEMEKAIKTANDYGMVLSDKGVKASADFTDSMTTLKNTMTGVKNNMMAEFLPSLTSVTDGLSGIFSGVNAEDGEKKIWYGISSLAEKLTKEAPKAFEIGGTIIKALASSITQNLPILLDAAVPVIMELGTGLIENAPMLISSAMSIIGTIASAIGNPENLTGIINSAVEIILMISNSISENADTVIPAIIDIIMQIITTLTDEKVLMPLLKAGLAVIQAVASGILKAIPVLIKNLPAIISNIVNFLVKSTPEIIQGAVQLLGGIIKAIPLIIVELGKALPQIISTLVKGLGAGLSQIKDVGSQLIRGLWDGIKNMSKWIGEKIKGFGEGVVKGLKNFFGIKSPSKLFRDEIGQMLALGLGEGFEEGMDETMSGMTAKAQNTAEEVANALTAPMAGLDLSGEYSLTGRGSTAAGMKNGMTINMGGQTFYIYASEGQDIRELAKAVSDEIQNLIDDKEKVYA